MNKTLIYGGILVAIVIATGSYFFPQTSEKVGGTRFPNGISADSTSPLDGEVRGTDLTITDDATISGGVLSVPTSLGATSTLTVGRIQTYATSSATRICIDFNTQATTTIAGTARGVVTWFYGGCN